LSLDAIGVWSRALFILACLQRRADQALTKRITASFLSPQMPSYCKVINLDKRLATERYTPIPIQYIWDVLGKYLQNITVNIVGLST
jgi:hypothetical protein